MGNKPMGKLINGKWDKEATIRHSEHGDFERENTTIRNWVTADGSSGYKAEHGRFHLYVSYACPWAHRTLIFRKLKQLDHAISVTVVDWHKTDAGWHFSERDGCVPDPLLGARFLRELYVAFHPSFTGFVTVPLLWDKKDGRAVNNESSEIIRMLNTEFGGSGPDFYPKGLRSEIDEINDIVYHTVNNGVYKCGNAHTQEAYEEAFDALFRTLDDLEERLGRQQYLVGDRLTEADLRLFPTLARFDAVYHGHFKCNLRRIRDYHNLSNYMHDLYRLPGVADTVNMKHIKWHYYHSHRHINPSGIVPKGPAPDFVGAHDRERSVSAAVTS